MTKSPWEGGYRAQKRTDEADNVLTETLYGELIETVIRHAGHLSASEAIGIVMPAFGAAGAHLIGAFSHGNREMISAMIIKHTDNICTAIEFNEASAARRKKQK